MIAAASRTRRAAAGKLVTARSYSRPKPRRPSLGDDRAQEFHDRRHAENRCRTPRFLRGSGTDFNTSSKPARVCGATTPPSGAKTNQQVKPLVFDFASALLVALVADIRCGFVDDVGGRGGAVLTAPQFTMLGIGPAGVRTIGCDQLATDLTATQVSGGEG